MKIIEASQIMMVFFWLSSRETLYVFFMTQRTFDMVALVCLIFNDGTNKTLGNFPSLLLVFHKTDKDVGTSESLRIIPWIRFPSALNESPLMEKKRSKCKLSKIDWSWFVFALQMVKKQWKLVQSHLCIVLFIRIIIVWGNSITFHYHFYSKEITHTHTYCKQIQGYVPTSSVGAGQLHNKSAPWLVLYCVLLLNPP